MKATNYEILFIIKTEFSESERTEITDKMQSLITTPGGVIHSFESLGLKDFAMELKKQKQGYYYKIIFSATKPQMDSLHEELKVFEKIFRQIIVKLSSIYPAEEVENLVKDVATQ